ncbi:uncharacterized protein TNCT_176621 [Trichonephila clavata]|uniref:Testis-expressed sequence 9 protein n=1 Tax=Trichonephila clavata TaxID=2740835 RepID=A0A8X6GA89_TRICU|nr:uncharacterized protein TNCT_176621 [Trichonephila clavata]
MNAQINLKIPENMASGRPKIFNDNGKKKDLDSKSADNLVNGILSDKGTTKTKFYTKKKSSQRQRKKTPLQDKSKKSLELEGESSASSNENVKMLDRKLPLYENSRISSPSIVNQIFDTALNKASGDKDTSSILDSGFKYIKEEMKTLIRQCIDKDDALIVMEKRLKETEKNYTESNKKCLVLEQKNEKLVKNLDDITKKYEDTVQELAGANTSIAELKQVKKKDDSIIADLEKRLSQTTEHNCKLKSKLDAANLDDKSAKISSQKEIEELTESNKLLGRQKSELREVVIKQMQLVANLRRQLMHLKAGIAQSFAKQEVLKAVEEFY